MVPLSFAGRNFLALTEGALFCPERRALFVADLHFEKASWFAARGQMLPPYDSLETVAAVEHAVARTGAAELWCLGDSFHDAGGCERLPEDVRARLTALTARLRWVWITGNHDAAMVDPCGGEVREEAVLDGLVLRHAADPADPRAELSGHYHPKLRISIRGRRIARRCFVASATKLVLPAFGALTGGLDAGHREIRRVVGDMAEALIPLDDRLLRFPLAA